jgi:RND family efflux transporter MFP subunit
VVRIVATDHLLVDYRVPQRHFAAVSTGGPVALTFASLPSRTLDGHIQAVVPVNDTSARTFLIRVKIDDDSAPVTPGMSAQGRLRIARDEQGVVVSRDAVLRYPDGRTTVWVVDDDGDRPTVAERQVATGLTFDGRVEIRSGLEAGSRVVVEGNESLQNGQQVVIRDGDGG